jgi:hypothetical protein
MKSATKPNSFNLRRLELSLPLVKAMEENDPKAFVNLAAIVMADDESLKIYCAGNKEILQPFLDKAYVMDADEVAALLSGFTSASKRFSLILSGFKPEEVNLMEANQRTKLAALLQDESASKPVDTSKP